MLEKEYFVCAGLRIAIYKDYLEWDDGIFAREQARIYYTDITSVAYSTGGLVSNAYISISIAGKTYSKKAMSADSQVGELADEIEKKRHEARQQQMQQTTQAPNPANELKHHVEEIKQYMELLNLGIISQAEFDAKKEQLLSYCGIASSNDSNVETASSQTASQTVTAPNTVITQLPDGKWKCTCGRVNAPYVSSCVCGKNKHECSTNSQVIAPAVDTQSSATTTSHTPSVASNLPDGKWKCTCGRVNASYVSSCVCGKNKHECSTSNISPTTHPVAATTSVKEVESEPDVYRAPQEQSLTPGQTIGIIIGLIVFAFWLLTSLAY